MKFIKQPLILILGSALLIIGIAAYWLLFSNLSDSNSHSYIYIDRDDTKDSVMYKVEKSVQPKQMEGFKLACQLLRYGSNIRPGCYKVGSSTSAMQLARNLRSGAQSPIMLTIPNVRTTKQLAAKISKQLATDSATFATAFLNEELCKNIGYTTATLPALFIANTYEVYWTITPEQLLERMQKEYKNFWTTARQKKAKAAGLTELEAITLASIVDQETANDAEKPDIAGLYLNRLKKGMLLQADPTVKFALQEFGLRRILNKHLTVDSPYNTYKYKGLPPGPIAIPAQSSIEAVLNHAHNDYLYMCAKEDFSGTHNFAVTYSEHLRNAARYTKALNERNIR